MRGNYNLQISNREDGGNGFRLVNTKNNKVAIFKTTEKNDKLFNFLFKQAMERVNK